MASSISVANTIGTPYTSIDDPDISRPTAVTASSSTMNGTPTARTTSPPYHDTSLSPSGYRSLSSIALHAFALGTSLGLCVLLAPYLALHHNRLWRLPEFIATLCIFHFLEFYTTARWNTPNARVSSFLLFSNGAAYNVAHASAMVEIAVSSLLFPRWQALGSSSLTLAVGAAMVVVGQVVRSVAMAEAGKSFNHIPQRKKRDDHVLVTSGVYAWVRHPSYFGYYYFAVGTQVVVGNKVCALVYAGVLWVFFRNRIADEEQYLIEFFGEEYVTFKKNVGTGLLFIK